MANITWIDETGSLGWDDTNAWDLSRIPVDGDAAFISGGTFTSPVSGPSSPVSLALLSVSADITLPDVAQLTISNGTVSFAGGNNVFNGAYSGTCDANFAGGATNSGSGTLTTGVFSETAVNGGVVTNGTFNDSSFNVGSVANLFLNSPSVNLASGTATTVIVAGIVDGTRLKITSYTSYNFGTFSTLAFEGIPPATGGGGPLGGPEISF